MRELLILCGCLYASSVWSMGSAPSEADFVGHLKGLRAKLEEAKSKESRVKVFHDFKSYLEAQDVPESQPLFFAITRLGEFAALVDEVHLDKEGCATSQTHIIFEAHPREEPAEEHLSGEAREVLGYLHELCHES